MNLRAISGGLLFSVATAALAHHSFAMFDQTRIVDLKGTVVDLQWTNPHVFLDIEVKDGPNAASWHVEANSPNNLKRQGWRPGLFKKGDSIDVVINPLRDGSHGGLFVTVTLADGTVLGDPTRGASGAINVPAEK